MVVVDPEPITRARQIINHRAPCTHTFTPTVVDSSFNYMFLETLRQENLEENHMDTEKTKQILHSVNLLALYNLAFTKKKILSKKLLKCLERGKKCRQAILIFLNN